MTRHVQVLLAMHEFVWLYIILYVYTVMNETLHLNCVMLLIYLCSVVVMPVN